jgi:hypothetical protein
MKQGYNNYGRYSVTRPDGRMFFVEPQIVEEELEGDWNYFMDPRETDEHNLAKSMGCASFKEDTLITPENGFINIVTLPPGESPNSWIEKQ